MKIEKMAIFRQGATSALAGPQSGRPGEKPLDQGENQQQTQPTYGTGPPSNLGHIGAKQAFLFP